MKNVTPNKMNETAAPLTSARPRPSCPAPPTLNPEPGTLNAASEEFISREELARRLKKSLRTIANWQRRRIIPFLKIENSTWFNWLDVQNHLERHFRICRTQPQPPTEGGPNDQS